MGKLKVYLQYPWKFPDSPYYKYLVENPPEGIEYLNVEKEKGVITSKKFFWFSNFLKRNIRRSLNLLRLSIPNAHLTKEVEKVDIIHCAHCLSSNKNKPWVADLEGAWSMWVSGQGKGKEKILKIIQGDNCKKLLPWAESAKEEVLKYFPEIANKVEVVYPAVPLNVAVKKNSSGPVKIIFVARYFDIKGGLIALETLERLRAKYGIEGIVVSTVPEKLKEKYSKLKIYDLMTHDELFKLLKSSDIFLYPSMIDTFGFSLLEAMSFGLPTVTVNTSRTKSRKEIIENDKTGIIFDVNEKIDYNKIGESEEAVIKKLVESSAKIITDDKLRLKMAENCIQEIKEGKFSLIERNKKLKNIYRKALLSKTG
jgi:glycosyltransferase involved in cell wall biosynthesis